MPERKPSKPRQGWIYMINPKWVVLRCKNGHTHRYNISGDEKVACLSSSCSLTINSSKVMRGEHPHIVWACHDYENFILFHAIPLTSKDTFRGLPTSYPIKTNQQNGLNPKKNSLALLHQIMPLDAECFKQKDGSWMERLGVIKTEEKRQISEQLKYTLELSNDPSDDWFQKNSNIELLQKVFLNLDKSKKAEGLSHLMDLLE